MNLKRIILLLFAFNFCKKFANCECFVKFERSPERRPIFKKHLGSNIVRVGDMFTERIKMHNGEKITGYCATKFDSNSKGILQISQENLKNNTNTIKRISHFFNQRRISLYCGSGKIYTGLTGPQHEINASTIFSCEPIEWGIYETKNPLAWCSTTAVSYILATIKFSPINILGSLCYNLENATLESLRYTTNNFSVRQDNQKVLLPIDLNPDFIDIEVKLEDFLAQQDINENGTESENEIMKTATYKEHSLVEGVDVNGLFKHYNEIFNVYWWENLFQTNWQRFLQSFNDRAALMKFDVYFGISGRLLVPEPKFCDGKETGEIKFMEHKLKIPAYIWSYIRSIDNNDDFVFISYNSPFSEFFNSSEIIFCEDICNEINWLSKIRSTFRYSTLGVSFCCSAQSVRNSKVFKNFPKLYKNAETESSMLSTKPTEASLKITTTLPKTVEIEINEENQSQAADYQAY